MKNKNKEKNEPKEEEKKLMKHFVEIGIPMHDLLYAHLRQANIGFEPGRSMFDDPAGAYITIDLINVLAAEWIQSVREKDRFAPDDKTIADGIKKVIEDGEKLRKKYDGVYYCTGSDILNILAIQRGWDLSRKLGEKSMFEQGKNITIPNPCVRFFDTSRFGVGVMGGLDFVTVTAKIINPTDKKPYKEKIEFKEEGSWMRDNVLGAAFCVKGIDRDCYIDTFGVRHPPLVCTFLGKPKFKEGEKIIARSEFIFTVENIFYDSSCSQFRYSGRLCNGVQVNFKESLCGPYVEKKPRYSKGTMLVYNGRNHLGIVETIEYRPNIGEHIYFVRFATGGFSWDKESVFTEYIPKPAVIGKPAIFWDNDKSKAFVAILSRVEFGYYPLEYKITSWENACLLESLEQYELFVKQ